MDAVFVAHRIDAVLCKDDEGKSAFHHSKGVHKAVDTVLSPVLLDEVCKEFRVRIGLQDASKVFQIVGYLGSVHQVALSGNCKVTGLVMEEKGLDVVQAALLRIGVLRAANAEVAAELRHPLLREHLPGKAYPPVVIAFAVLVEGGYSGTLLSPVLQAVKPEIYYLCGVAYPIYSKYAHTSYAFSNLSITF